MALIYCPECGHQVSDTAPACPHCGQPSPGAAMRPPRPEPSTMSRWGWLFGLLGLLVIGAIVGLVFLLDGDDGDDSIAGTASIEGEAAPTDDAATPSDLPGVDPAPDPTPDPTDPESVEPDPTDPDPTDPEPTDPDPTEPEPTEPEAEAPSGTPPPSVLTDCIGYDPSGLTIEDLGDNGWRLNDGGSALLLYDDRADAEFGLAIASNHTELCFIGRGNTQADRDRYVHEFYNGDSGLGVPAPGPADCIAYDRTSLTIEDLGSNVWRLVAAGAPMASFDGEADAQAGLALADAYGEQCFIGRDNSRTERIRYIREFWR